MHAVWAPAFLPDCVMVEESGPKGSEGPQSLLQGTVGEQLLPPQSTPENVSLSLT